MPQILPATTVFSDAAGDFDTMLGGGDLDWFITNAGDAIGDLNTPHGDNNQLFSPSTGYPAITVPMGYTRGVLPAGLQFFGRPWGEETLIRLAYSYEQATRWRREPTTLGAMVRH